MRWNIWKGDSEENPDGEPPARPAATAQPDTDTSSPSEPPPQEDTADAASASPAWTMEAPDVARLRLPGETDPDVIVDELLRPQTPRREPAGAVLTAEISRQSLGPLYTVATELQVQRRDTHPVLVAIPHQYGVTDTLVDAFDTTLLVAPNKRAYLPVLRQYLPALFTRRTGDLGSARVFTIDVCDDDPNSDALHRELRAKKGEPLHEIGAVEFPDYYAFAAPPDFHDTTRRALDDLGEVIYTVESDASVIQVVGFTFTNKREGSTARPAPDDFEFEWNEGPDSHTPLGFGPPDDSSNQTDGDDPEGLPETDGAGVPERRPAQPDTSASQGADDDDISAAPGTTSGAGSSGSTTTDDGSDPASTENESQPVDTSSDEEPASEDEAETPDEQPDTGGHTGSGASPDAEDGSGGHTSPGSDDSGDTSGTTGGGRTPQESTDEATDDTSDESGPDAESVDTEPDEPPATTPDSTDHSGGAAPPQSPPADESTPPSGDESSPASTSPSTGGSSGTSSDDSTPSTAPDTSSGGGHPSGRESTGGGTTSPDPDDSRPAPDGSTASSGTDNRPGTTPPTQPETETTGSDTPGDPTNLPGVPGRSPTSGGDSDSGQSPDGAGWDGDTGVPPEYKPGTVAITEHVLNEIGVHGRVHESDGDAQEVYGTLYANDAGIIRYYNPVDSEEYVLRSGRSVVFKPAFKRHLKELARHHQEIDHRLAGDCHSHPTSGVPKQSGQDKEFNRRVWSNERNTELIVGISDGKGPDEWTLESVTADDGSETVEARKQMGDKLVRIRAYSGTNDPKHIEIKRTMGG